MIKNNDIFDNTMARKERVFYRTVPLVSNREIAPAHFVLELECPDIAGPAHAGQFVMIRPAEVSNTLLARPLSIYRKEKGRLFFLYKIYGKGSKNLSLLGKGETVNIWGPLGNGFEIVHGRPWVFAAGGIGVAPFMFLAQDAPAGTAMTLFFGIKTRSQAILEKEFLELGCRVVFVTEDGSLGEKGLVTPYLESFIKQLAAESPEVYTCGPRPMEFNVAGICLQNSVRCQVAYEEYMGCGLGTCMGCVVKCRVDRDYAYKRVCREGPVFMADEIVWES